MDEAVRGGGIIECRDIVAGELNQDARQFPVLPGSRDEKGEKILRRFAGLSPVFRRGGISLTG